jgi:MSHA biogenesis protein MshO
MMPVTIRNAEGFTLVETVMVIAITGIIAAIVAVFIRAPVEGYFDAAARAEITDTADTALRRIGRDLRLALPNSARVAGGGNVLEFLSTRTGGRYRIEAGAPGDDPLEFGAADTSFDVLGPALTGMTPGDQIVIYNLGIPGADAYEGNTAATHNRRSYNGAAGTVSNIAISSVNPFPLESPGRRFQVVDTPVTYICDGLGNLWRYWGYAIQGAQPNTVAALNGLVGAGNTKALLAKNVTSCQFTYEGGITERSGLIAMRLTITQNGESVSLYHQVHVSNVP